MPGQHTTALFLGRDREVAALNDTLEAARRGVPQTVLVVGDAGIGKTTLVTQVTQHAAELGFAVAVGHCLDLEADISFAPVVEAVRALVSSSRISSPVRRRDACSHCWTRTPPALPEPFRVLEDLRQTVAEATAAAR